MQHSFCPQFSLPTQKENLCSSSLSEIVKIIPTSFAQVFFLFSRRKSLRIVTYLKNFQRRKMEKEQAKGRNCFDNLTY